LNRTLSIREKTLGVDHPSTAFCLAGLGQLCQEQQRYAEAGTFYQRALQIRRKVLGEEHSEVGVSLRLLAELYRLQRRYSEAEQSGQKALAVLERAKGPDHPDVADVLHTLAALCYDQGLPARAAPLVERAILLRDRAQLSPGQRFESYELRARVAWDLGHKSEAVADLHQAMDLAEQQRAYGSGAEQERAEFFARFAPAFERMVAWQAELGDLSEALMAIERGRARSLLDEMQASGADLDVGRPAAEREELRRREGEQKSRVATLENQVADAEQNKAENAGPLRDQLAKARKALYEHCRDERSSNPVYRNLLSVGAGPPRLSQLQRQLVANQGLLLVYLLGDEGGYVLAVRPESA
jgi:tetratricopeptide (TPR) repeat protein